jgi:hypothetical protein
VGLVGKLVVLVRRGTVVRLVRLRIGSAHWSHWLPLIKSDAP